MTKKARRKILTFLSFVAILLCMSLFMGTAYAWFTDTATSKDNVIKTGTLEAKMYFALGTEDPEAATWVNAESTPIFNGDKWEPGYVEARHIRIENEGNLAFKYRIVIVPNGEYEPLAELIDVYFVDGATKLVDRAMLTEDYKVGTLNELIADSDGAAYGVLLPSGVTPREGTNEVSGSKDCTIALKLREDAGDEFQNKSIGESFEIKAIATQYSFESDSFGSDYDANIPETSKWNGESDTTWYNDTDTKFELSSAEQLAGFASLVDAGNTFEGKTITLTNDMDLGLVNENGESICFEPIGSYRNDQVFKGTFDGQGHTIKNLNQNTWALDNGYSYGDLGLGLFGAVENATIKNLNIDGAEISGESALCGTIAAVAGDGCSFDNITIKNANVADYQYYAGGIVGWASGKQNYTNCKIDASTSIAAQWGDFDNSIGGLIGGIGGSAEILIKDCEIACRIDAFNDVTSSYQWYAYRRAGMIVGNSGKTGTTEEGKTIAIAPQLTCENVTVIYGDWANYTYCEFAGTNWPYVRVQAGVSTSAYSNPRYGNPTDANGNKVVDDNHVHNEGEDHFVLCVFDQLYGGGQGVCGNPVHEGVTVIYNNK